MARKKTKSPKPITSTKHHDKRANIPTEELRDFAEAASQSGSPLKTMAANLRWSL